MPAKSIITLGIGANPGGLGAFILSGLMPTGVVRTASCRIYTVLTEDRRLLVVAENRTLEVATEDRTYEVTCG